MKLLFYIIESLIVIFGTFLYNKFHKNLITKMTAASMTRLLLFSVVGLGIFTGSIVLMDYIEGFYIFQSVAGKSWLSDLVTVLVFPTIVTWIREILKRDPSTENKYAAAAIIITVSLLEYLFFHSLGIIRILWMIGMNCITVGTMLFSIDKIQGEKDAMEQLKWLIGYAIFWTGLVLLFWEKTYYGFGRIDVSLLEQYDTFTASLYIAAVLAFIQLITKYLGSAWKDKKKSYLIYQAAYVNLMLKAILGLLYMIGILPFRVRLPFSNGYGILTDAVCIAFLILSEKENKHEIY